MTQSSPLAPPVAQPQPLATAPKRSFSAGNQRWAYRRRSTAPAHSSRWAPLGPSAGSPSMSRPTRRTVSLRSRPPDPGRGTRSTRCTGPSSQLVGLRTGPCRHCCMSRLAASAPAPPPGPPGSEERPSCHPAPGSCTAPPPTAAPRGSRRSGRDWPLRRVRSCRSLSTEAVLSFAHIYGSSEQREGVSPQAKGFSDSHTPSFICIVPSRPAIGCAP